MTYRVVYHDTPLAFTQSAAMTVEADSKEAAFATAYDHLTRRGKRVMVDDHTLDNYLQKEGGVTLDRQKLAEYGLPLDEPGHLGTIIMRIDEHNVKAPGRVL